MKRYSIYLILAGLFMLTSALLYSIHYLFFRDTHHIFIFMVGDLAFLPLEVFLVVIIIERLLTRREKRALLQKLNMVVGAFFSEVGTELLHRLHRCFDRHVKIQLQLTVNQNWTHADFKKAIAFADAIEDEPHCHDTDLEELRTFLIEKRGFLLRLLENPNLLEHDHFTALLWATFHLDEELAAKPSTSGLPEADLKHIGSDIRRVYGHLAAEWLAYAEHLQANYPYLFSLVLRTQPFQEHPSPVVT